MHVYVATAAAPHLLEESLQPGDLRIRLWAIATQTA
jgi:hypothetical protein